MSKPAACAYSCEVSNALVNNLLYNASSVVSEIEEALLDEKRVELPGKGSRIRKIPVLYAEVLRELNLSERFVYLPAEKGRLWKDGLERYVRQGCNTLGIHRRGVHGFRATAACEFVDVKRALGYTEAEARRELAVWLGHNPHRTEVTYAYVPKFRST